MTIEEARISLPLPLTPQQIRSLRERHGVTKKAFASLLNVSTTSVEEWESGDHQPSPFALKLLSVVEKHGLEILA